MKADAKEYTINQARNDPSGSLYVLNKFVFQPSRGRPQQGEVLITHISQYSNQPELIRIPVTFIPWDIAEEVAKEEILKNSSFLKQVRMKNLVLVDPKTASNLMEQPKYQQERDRIIMNIRRKRPEELQQNPVSPSQLNSPQAQQERQSEKAPPAISPQVVNIMNADTSDEERANALENILPVLNKDDLNYIANNTQNKEILAMVKRP